jgi:hypothetical protein
MEYLLAVEEDTGNHPKEPGGGDGFQPRRYEGPSIIDGGLSRYYVVLSIKDGG